MDVTPSFGDLSYGKMLDSVYDPRNGLSYTRARKDSTMPSTVLLLEGGPTLAGTLNFTYESNNSYFSSGLINSYNPTIYYGLLLTTYSPFGIAMVENNDNNKTFFRFTPDSSIYDNQVNLLINKTSLGPNIVTSSLTSVGTLTSLTVSGTATAGNVNTSGALNLLYQLGANSYVGGSVLSYNPATYYGLLLNSYGAYGVAMMQDNDTNKTFLRFAPDSSIYDNQVNLLINKTSLGPNIVTSSLTSVGTLTSLTVSGSISGTLATAAQPNITSLGTLTNVNTSGAYQINGTDFVASRNTNSVAVGPSAGTTSQGATAVAIGSQAGSTTQGASSTAVGASAGRLTQGTNAIALGIFSGEGQQGAGAVAVGRAAGQNSQGSNAVAIGWQSARYTQSSNAVAIGADAGAGTTTAGTGQGANAIAIGNTAGNNTQGASAIAIGQLAGQTNQHANSVILNATGAALNSDGTSRFFVKPVRQDATVTTLVGYNSTSGEITYGAVPAAPAISSFWLAANTQITTSNTIQNLGSLTLAAGTYLLQVYGQASGTGLTRTEIWLDPTSAAISANNRKNGYPYDNRTQTVDYHFLQATTVITLASSTTLYLNGRAISTQLGVNFTCWVANDTGVTATKLG